MTPELSNRLNQWLLATADDRLILAHRDSEWTGHAPILEEDIALANIAQDELGHATVWYGLLTTLEEQAANYPDWLVYQRQASQWRNLQLLELPKGDWAFTMLRQYFMDVYQHVSLGGLEHSTHQEIANIAGKLHREKLYHLKHSTAWVKRLALGTDESHRRMQTALESQWPYLGQLFQPFSAIDIDEALAQAGVIPSGATVQTQWQQIVLPMLAAVGLSVPVSPALLINRTDHTPYLDELLTDLQQVFRLDPQAAW